MSELEPRKQQLIQEFKKLSQGKSQEEMLPLILALSQKAKDAGITFTLQDIMTFINET